MIASRRRCYRSCVGLRLRESRLIAGLEQDVQQGALVAIDAFDFLADTKLSA